jgi:CheY-like chemotaxis protein
MSFDPNCKIVVLLAEDDDNDVLLFSRAIKSSGLACDVKSVSDGQQAIDYLQRNPPFADKQAFPFPRFLILDLKMPRKSGFEVLEWLQEHPECKVIPTIVFSSSKIADDVKRAYQLGANSYFTKPNDYEELKSVFQLMLKYWEKANVPPIPARQSCT